MRSFAILLCCVGVVISWVVPQIILAIHAAHGISTYREFEVLELVNERQLESIRKRPGYENYSIEAKVRAIGATSIYLGYQSVIHTVLFVAIGLVVFCIGKNWIPVDPSYQSATDRGKVERGDL